MPAYIFSGLVPMTFPESRDADGRHLGLVDPGDIRFFDDGPPDSLTWSPANGDETAHAGGEPEPEPGASADSPGETAGQDSGAAEGDAPDPGPGENEPAAF